MAETTHALITDEDVTKARLGAYGCAWADADERGEWRAGLEAVAPALRARWVAEALETIAARESQALDDLAGDLTVGAVTVHRLRVLAAEYRDGRR